MFGQTNNDNLTGNMPAMDPSAASQVPAVDPAADSTVAAAPVDHQMTPAYPVDNEPQSPVSDTPASEDGSLPGLGDDSTTEVVPSPAPDPAAPSEPAASTADSTATAPADNDLLTIKQDALDALAPLVGQLEQSPEEKFRTTMMMIQASDDKALVKAAYEAAQAITDEKIKAQALLDVINEINYFTSHQS